MARYIEKRRLRKVRRLRQRAGFRRRIIKRQVAAINLLEGGKESSVSIHEQRLRDLSMSEEELWNYVLS